MKKEKKIIVWLLIIISLNFNCQKNNDDIAKNNVVDLFADIQVLKYNVNGWEKLNLNQKKLVYYLTQAGYAGRDIMYDQNYKYNIKVRKILEKILINHKGNTKSTEWKDFLDYVKQIWFSNGIHHHYSNDKIIPRFTEDYFNHLLKETKIDISDTIYKVIFDKSFDNKKICTETSKDLIKNSAVNFYEGDINAIEVEQFYNSKINNKENEPVSYGLNSTLIKDINGNLIEDVWKVGGRYSKPIENIVFWLRKAVSVSENEKQRNALKLLIEYFESGDLKKWDEYNVEWTNATEGDIDYILGFIETYDDPLGYKASFESIVQIKDFEATKQMKVLMDNAQWFETNSTIPDQYKKEEVKGISYNVVEVVGESGDASPSTPIGVNLPNSNWIRIKHGSKSVSLGNIIEAYSSSTGNKFIDEFYYSTEDKELAKIHGKLASKLHTAMHEVIGHASGKLSDNNSVTTESLKNYSGVIEEARADLVALYFIYDKKMMDLGLISTLDVGKASYNSYILNGLMLQLRRIKLGNKIEQTHMRDRQMISSWVFEKGKTENIIEKVQKENKTYFKINDYDKLRVLFGNLLREIQRIKSEGDFETAKNLVENYGVQVDSALHIEVLKRDEKMGIPPYSGFINPVLTPVLINNEIKDIKLDYSRDFVETMLYYSKEFETL